MVARVRVRMRMLVLVLAPFLVLVVVPVAVSMLVCVSRRACPRRRRDRLRPRQLVGLVLVAVYDEQPQHVRRIGEVARAGAVAGAAYPNRRAPERRREDAQARG